jgi:MoaA/NifB/PqqE/SkfB family radical SAM enzyme
VPRPLNVILDLTARCNLKCVMCYFANADRLSFPPFDRQLSDDGNMPVEVFERIAADLFPRAWRVALACAAEPMIHPRFKEIVGIAGRYGVPDLWFPTNLLAMTEPTARALIDARVATVAASIDGMTPETYEKIRVPAKWDRLLAALETLRKARRDARSKTPRLRIIFTWMRSNREELARLPEFAQQQGAVEIDVRYVSQTPGVDVSGELLSGESTEELNAELASAARDAVRRG